MDVRLGQFKKTTTKLTAGNINVVPKENAMNLMECEEIKLNSASRSWHTIAHKYHNIYTFLFHQNHFFYPILSVANLIISFSLLTDIGLFEFCSGTS